MPFDIAVDEQEFGANEDRSWLGARKGTNTCRSKTLDVSAFSAAHITSGAIPSGTALAELPSGKLGPYSPAGSAGTGDDVAEVSTITRTATGGTFNILINGDASDDIDASAAVTAAAIQAAVRAINPDFAEFTVAGAAGGPFTMTAVGMEGENIDVAIDDSAATGGGDVVAEATAGAAGDLGTGFGLLFNTTPVGRLGSDTNLATAADVGVPVFWEGIVKRSKLPTFAGTNVGEIDDAFEADMPHIRFED